MPELTISGSFPTLVRLNLAQWPLTKPSVQYPEVLKRSWRKCMPREFRGSVHHKPSQGTHADSSFPTTRFVHDEKTRGWRLCESSHRIRAAFVFPKGIDPDLKRCAFNPRRRITDGLTHSLCHMAKKHVSIPAGGWVPFWVPYVWSIWMAMVHMYKPVLPTATPAGYKVDVLVFHCDGLLQRQVFSPVGHTTIYMGRLKSTVLKAIRPHREILKAQWQVFFFLAMLLWLSDLH